MVHYYGSMPFRTKIITLAITFVMFLTLLVVMWAVKSLRIVAARFTPIIASFMSFDLFVGLIALATELGWSDNLTTLLFILGGISLLLLIAFIIHAKRKYT